MSATYLVHRKTGVSYSFRSVIPKDLQTQLGTREFQLSLRCGILKQAKLLSAHLHNLTQNLYAKIRHSSGQLKISTHEIKEILKAELAKLYHSGPIPKIIGKVEVASRQPEITSRDESSHNGITLSELSKKFLSSKTEVGYPDKTVNGYRDTHKLILEVLGDIPIDSLTHEDGRKFVQTIKQLPANRSKKYPTLSVKELLELKDMQTLNPKTILKHTERVSALFNWAIKQGYTSQNVFRGKLEPTLNNKQQVIEKHFSQQELDLILGDALQVESLQQDKPERYWVTMIAAYSGARLNEICQLNVNDIQQQEGIWVMKLLSDTIDKSVKTQAGNRVVPVHPKLLELGFLDYVQQVSQFSSKKLFPNLKNMISTGYGTLISRWFARYLKRLGIKKKGKNFHSFRHTVVNRLTTKQVYEPFIRELIGHSHGSLTMDVYGGRKPLEVLLNECVKRI